MNFEEVKFDEPGVCIFSLPEEIFSELTQQTNQLRDLPKGQKKILSYSSNLAGQITKQLSMDISEKIKTFILNSAIQYSNFYKVETRGHIINSIWVNFQEKYEYNPPHMHSNCDLSFVIYIKIPYLLESEDKFPNTIDSKEHSNGRFSILYSTKFNGLACKDIDLDKSYEGKMLLFPANTMHCVYPFYTSDEYRISVAGNLKKII